MTDSAYSNGATAITTATMTESIIAWSFVATALTMSGSSVGAAATGLNDFDYFLAMSMSTA